MKKCIVTIIVLLTVSDALYFGSFFLFTNKYRVLYTSNTCDIARTVSHEWQRHFYYPAAFIELKLVGQPLHKPSIQIDTPEIRQYFSGQQQMCGTNHANFPYDDPAARRR
jgi:hypothetical protein